MIWLSAHSTFSVLFRTNGDAMGSKADGASSYTLNSSMPLLCLQVFEHITVCVGMIVALAASTTEVFNQTVTVLSNMTFFATIVTPNVFFTPDCRGILTSVSSILHLQSLKVGRRTCGVRRGCADDRCEILDLFSLFLEK